MPRPRTDSTDPAVIRRREYRARRKLGLVAVSIGGERLDMHADDAATLYAEAREMQRQRALSGRGNQDMTMSDTPEAWPYIPGRDPYTYAADFLRGFCADGEQVAPGVRSCAMSRGTASRVRQAIAKEIGMDDAELAAILSRAYQRENNIRQ